MVKFNRLTTLTSLMAATAAATLIAHPGLAQSNPSVFSEPNYDGNPATRQAPVSTPAPALNPNPSIFSEFGVERQTPGTQAQSGTQGSSLNPNPAIFSELGVDRSQAAPATTISSASSQTTSLDQQFMRMAAHSDQFEIRSSQLALQKSS
ncbi:MAG: hypothetical protein F6K28_36255, partial [Microcoleus sp. SIO2G3]|nr:hypothetical protein [Microcoleus sp. SIO2G3]